MINKLLNWICSIIPKINNKVMLMFYEVLRKLHRRPKGDISLTYWQNKNSFVNHLEQIEKQGGYIEDQNNYPDIKYGKKTISFSGCEIIAVYNVIQEIFTEKRYDFAKLIEEFEKDGCVLSGKFGTAPIAMADFFKRRGYATEVSIKEKDYKQLENDYDSFILTMYNDKHDIRKEIHTVSISKNGGKYIAHNVYCNGTVTKPYSSINELIDNINNGRAKAISLIGIRRK